LSCGNLMPAAVGIIPRPCLWDLDSLHIHHHIHRYVVYVGPFLRLPMESTGWVVRVWDCESRVMGFIPTQWTGMLYWYVVLVCYQLAENSWPVVLLPFSISCTCQRKERMRRFSVRRRRNFWIMILNMHVVRTIDMLTWQTAEKVMWWWCIT